MKKSISDKTLLARARQAANNSYSPYSRFPVGAAVLAEGKVYAGCNVENASYGLTVCAERVALAAAVSAGRRRPRKLAIVGGRKKAARPCGACLQVLSEFCGPDFPILLAPIGNRAAVERLTLADLLPKAFRIDSVKCRSTD